MRKILLVTASLLPFWGFSSQLPDSVIVDALYSNFPEAAQPEHEFSHLLHIYQDKKFVLGAGGCIITTASYDFGNVLSNPNEFKSFEIPVGDSNANDCKVAISAQQTHLYINAVALPTTKDQVGAFFKVYLLGEAYMPKIEYALISYRGFTMGYGYTLFADMGAMIPTIDFECPCSYTAVGNAGINYSNKINENLTVSVGAEMPIMSATYDKYTSEASQRVPDIAMAAKYSWKDGESWLRVAALLRNMTYHNDVLNRNSNCVGWGVESTGRIACNVPLVFTWQATAGKGITSYYQDFTDGRMDLMPDADVSGKLKAVPSWGLYGGVEYTVSDKCYCSVGYGQVRALSPYYHDGDVSYGDQCRYAQYLVGNVFYNFNNYLTGGIEYIYGRRVNSDMQQGHNNRVQAMLRFAF